MEPYQSDKCVSRKTVINSLLMKNVSKCDVIGSFHLIRANICVGSNNVI